MRILDFSAFEGTVYQNAGGAKFWGDQAAGLLPICPNTGRLLVCFRSADVNEPHTFSTWGGKMDPEDDHDPEKAAKRELEEETGYTGEYKLVPAYVFRKGIDFSYHNYLAVVQAEFEPKLDWESEGFKWVTGSELEKLEPKHFGLVALLKNSGDLIEKYLDK